jgi:hypothetical protein
MSIVARVCGGSTSVAVTGVPPPAGSATTVTSAVALPKQSLAV